MANPKVAIVKGPKNPDEKEIDAQVRQAIELAGGLPDKIKPGDTVIIKPNIVCPKPLESAVNTDPRVCKAIANMVRELGARPIIAEASGVGYDTEEAIQAAGYGKLREEGYEVIDLKKEGIETVKVPVPKGKKLKEVFLPKVVVEAKAIIDVPKMKTHDQTQVTLSLKNMKGILPDIFKRKFHTTFGIMQAVADLMTVAKPDLSVVDGIIAMEGLGPVFGDPVEMGLIIAGKDPVAVDAVTSEIMGFEPADYGCVYSAAQAGIGIDDLSKIEVVGEPIANVKRRFKNSVEAINEKIPFPEGFQVIIDERACTGCRNQVLSSLVDLKEIGLLDEAAGWCVVAGKIDKVPDVSRERLLLVGACTARFRKEGTFVEGCPPNSTDVTRGLGIKQAVGVSGKGVDEIG